MRAVLLRNTTSRLEVGASLCIFHGGRCVLNITGGSCSNVSNAPSYDDDTLQIVFSSTKGIVAMCLGLCVDRGLLKFNDPVSTHWPEFGAAGKSAITVAHVLSHSWGMHALEGGAVTLAQAIEGTSDGSCEVLRRIAASPAAYAAGSCSGYHGHSGGYVLGEIIRRVSGRNVGDFITSQLAAPLGVEFYCGLPAAHFSRLSKVNLGWSCKTAPPLQNTYTHDPKSPHNLSSEQMQRVLEVTEKGSPGYASLTLNGAFRQNMAGVFNRPDVLEAQLPSVNGVTNARSLAKIYSAAVLPTEGSQRLLSRETLDVMRCRVTAAGAVDAVLRVPLEFGLGFMVGGDVPWKKHASSGSFGHTGAGGSVSFADVQNELAFAYVPNKMQPGILGDYRAEELIESAYACLAEQRRSSAAREPASKL